LPGGPAKKARRIDIESADLLEIISLESAIEAALPTLKLSFARAEHAFSDGSGWFGALALRQRVEIELPVDRPAAQKSRVAFRPRRWKLFPAS